MPRPSAPARGREVEAPPLTPPAAVPHPRAGPFRQQHVVGPAGLRAGHGLDPDARGFDGLAKRLGRMRDLEPGAEDEDVDLRRDVENGLHPVIAPSQPDTDPGSTRTAPVCTVPPTRKNPGP
jgi:hypothetical protein